MIPDEEEYPKHITYACFYCKAVIGVSNQNCTPMILSCTNHSEITVYHHYEDNKDEPRNLSILYDFEGTRYDVFVAINNLIFCPKNTMEIGYYNNGYYVTLYRRPIPSNFTPEQIPNLIKQLSSLKAFL